MQARDVRHRDDASDASCAQQQDHRSQADEDMSSSEEEENQDALNDDDDDEELAGLPDNADVPNADVFGVLLNALGGNQPNNHPPNHAAIARLIGLGMSVRLRSNEEMIRHLTTQQRHGGAILRTQELIDAFTAIPRGDFTPSGPGGARDEASDRPAHPSTAPMGAYQPLLSASLQSRAASPPALPHSLLSPTHAPPCSALSADKQQMAFADCPFRVHALDFNISAPSLQAMALEHIGLKLCDDFLDIGSGCGHVTTVAARLVGPLGSSIGIEIRPEIVSYAQNKVAAFVRAHPDALPDGCMPAFELRNCFVPDIKGRRFDGIHVGASCPESRVRDLVALLKPGGRLVVPVESDFRFIRRSSDPDDQALEPYTSQVLSSVRYGDLVLPPGHEVALAKAELEYAQGAKVREIRCTLEEDLARAASSAAASGRAPDLRALSPCGSAAVPECA